MLKESEAIVNKEDLSIILENSRRFNEIIEMFRKYDIELIEDGKLRNIRDVFDDISFIWNNNIE